MNGRATMMALLLLSAAPSAAAQDESAAAGTDVGSVSLVYARAQGPSAQHVGHGLGLAASGHHGFGRRGIFAIGFEATYLLYGFETQTLRGYAEAETKSEIFVLGLGPQVRAPLGLVEPYAGVSLGAALFWTGSCIRDDSVVYPPPEDDCTERALHKMNLAFPAAAVGGGLRVRLTGGSEPVWLDLGTRYQVTTRARYVTQGGVSSAGDGILRFETAESATALWLFTLGVSMRL